MANPHVKFTVFAVVAWFGSDEWVEQLFDNEASAEQYCATLWTTRKSITNPDFHAQGFVKFGVEPMEVF